MSISCFLVNRLNVHDGQSYYLHITRISTSARTVVHLWLLERKEKKKVSIIGSFWGEMLPADNHAILRLSWTPEILRQFEADVQYLAKVGRITSPRDLINHKRISPT
jgi:hypothetical protein